MSRVLALAFALLHLALAAPAAHAQASFEPETDRPGGDYARLLNIPSANACQQSCMRDNKCAAWTYAAGPRDCWLKQSQQRPVYKANNISGVVRGGSGGGNGVNPGSKFEPETDRPTGDFARLLNIASANACQQACVQNNRCKSWTYAQTPRDCWLKETRPSPVYKANNISGVVR